MLLRTILRPFVSRFAQVDAAPAAEADELFRDVVVWEVLADARLREMRDQLQSSFTVLGNAAEPVAAIAGQSGLGVGDAQYTRHMLALIAVLLILANVMLAAVLYRKPAVDVVYNIVHNNNHVGNRDDPVPQ